MIYTQADYERERALCDKAAAYVDQFRGRNGWASLTPEQASHPDYMACSNDMRGRVEQYEVLRDLPDTFTAYLASGEADGIGARVQVTVWTGAPIGLARVCTIGKPSRYGVRQRYGRAMIGSREYRWQGQGAGMYARFRAIGPR